MKALITIAMLCDVDSREEAEEIRDACDLAAWSSVHAVLAAHGNDWGELEGLITMFPATATVELAEDAA